MAGITLQQAQDALDAAMAALADARTKQSYTISSTSGGRTNERASHASLLKEVQYWRSVVAQLSRGGGLRVYGGVFCG